MSASVRKRKVPRIDTVPLPELIAKGRLTRVAGKYYLTARGKKQVIPSGYLLPELQAKALVGRDVAVAYSRKNPSVIVALGQWSGLDPSRPVFTKCVMCYYAPDRYINHVHDIVRGGIIIDGMKTGLMSKRLGRILLGNLKR